MQTQVCTHIKTSGLVKNLIFSKDYTSKKKKNKNKTGEEIGVKN